MSNYRCPGLVLKQRWSNSSGNDFRRKKSAQLVVEMRQKSVPRSIRLIPSLAQNWGKFRFELSAVFTFTPNIFFRHWSQSPINTVEFLEVAMQAQGVDIGLEISRRFLWNHESQFAMNLFNSKTSFSPDPFCLKNVSLKISWKLNFISPNSILNLENFLFFRFFKFLEFRSQHLKKPL